MHAWVLLLIVTIVTFVLAIIYKIKTCKKGGKYEEQIWLGIIIIGLALSFLTIQTALVYPDLILGMEVR